MYLWSVLYMIVYTVFIIYFEEKNSLSYVGMFLELRVLLQVHSKVMRQ